MVFGLASQSCSRSLNWVNQFNTTGIVGSSVPFALRAPPKTAFAVQFILLLVPYPLARTVPSSRPLVLGS